MREGEERVQAAEARADEGAIAWREKLLQVRESHAAALDAERSEGKRAWKARLQALQSELRAEMHALAVLPGAPTGAASAGPLPHGALSADAYRNPFAAGVRRAAAVGQDAGAASSRADEATRGEGSWAPPHGPRHGSRGESGFASSAASGKR